MNAPLDRLVKVTPEARQLLDAETLAWTGRVQFAPTVVHGADSVRARAIGYEPVRDEQVFPHTRWKLEGRSPADDADEVIIAPSVARLLHVKPGDHVVLQVRTHHVALNALDVQVVGIFSTGNMALDALGMRVPQALTLKLTQADAPSHVLAKLRFRNDAARLKPKLQAALGATAEVATLQEETAEMLALQGTRRSSLQVLVFIILALAGFGMANTFLMAAYERTREVGTLRAMGMTEGEVVLLFMTEGTLVGLGGSLLGAAWGGGLAAWWAAHPIDFTQMMEGRGMNNISFNALVYTHFSPAVMVTGVMVGVVVALVSSWYPARVASALRPADAVRA
jgi:putative ABC transport system permease protein